MQDRIVNRLDSNFQIVRIATLENSKAILKLQSPYHPIFFAGSKSASVLTSGVLFTIPNGIITKLLIPDSTFIITYDTASFEITFNCGIYSNFMTFVISSELVTLRYES